MTLARGCLPLVILMAIAVVSCQTKDKAQQPRFTSDGKGQITVSANEISNRHFIEFRSRYALSYGHTYVVFGRTDKNGNMVDPQVAGLAPASTDPGAYVLGHFVPVSATTGATDGDLEEAYRSASWRVMLSDAEYEDAVRFIRKQQASSRLWEATVYNCNAFVANIARHMGYKPPGIWLRPQQFITKLREMNTG
jgi:hypothetical protein